MKKGFITSGPYLTVAGQTTRAVYQYSVHESTLFESVKNKKWL